MIHGHGGNIEALARRLGCPTGDIVDMSSNVNPLGPPLWLLDHLAERLENVRRLPEADAGATVARMADFLGRAPETVIGGNGTTELIYRLPRALTPGRVLIVGPTYADYADACRQCGIAPHYYLTAPEHDFTIDVDALEKASRGMDMVFMCNPNNPTGAMTAPAAIHALCRRLPGTCFVVDESYMPFAEPAVSMSRYDCGNLVVLHSLSKIFTLPGLRIGFVTAAAGIIERMRRFAQPWSMNALATAAVDDLMDHPTETGLFVQESVRFLEDARRRFAEGIDAGGGIRIFASRTSFVLLALPGDVVSGDVCGYLGRRRVLIRDCANFHGLSNRFVRVSLKTAADNRRCVTLLNTAVEALR